MSQPIVKGSHMFGANLFKTIFGKSRDSSIIERGIAKQHEEFPWLRLMTLPPDTETPRHPPIDAGIPFCSIENIARANRDLIMEAKQVMRMTDKQFSELVYPCILRYAEYVHLLPGSEQNHHRGAGGLFAHGVEVGVFAAKKSLEYDLCSWMPSKDKAINEPVWQFAYFIGGLCHDLGKPIYDITITSATQEGLIWTPTVESLRDWGVREKITRYTIKWRRERHQKHEKLGLIVLNRILSPECLTYLSHPGPDILSSLYESVGGEKSGDLLSQTVAKCDGESARLDLKTHGLVSDPYNNSTLVVKHTLSAIRSISKTEPVNQPGAKIWVLDDGVYLQWKALFPLIERYWDKNRVIGVPKNLDTIAEILIEDGIAMAHPEESLVSYNNRKYFRLYPDAMPGVHILALKIINAEIIFTDGAPSIASGLVDPTPAEIERRNKPQQTESTDQNVENQVNDGKVESEIKAENHAENNNNSEQEISSEVNFKKTPGWNIIKLVIEQYSHNKTFLKAFPDGKLGIPHPVFTEMLGEAKTVVTALNSEGLLDLTMASAGAVTRIEKDKFLILSTEVTSIIKKEVRRNPQGIEKIVNGDTTQSEDAISSFKKNFRSLIETGNARQIFTKVETNSSETTSSVLVSVSSEDLENIANSLGVEKSQVIQSLRGMSDFLRFTNGEVEGVPVTVYEYSNL